MQNWRKAYSERPEMGAAKKKEPMGGDIYYRQGTCQWNYIGRIVYNALRRLTIRIIWAIVQQGNLIISPFRSNIVKLCSIFCRFAILVPQSLQFWSYWPHPLTDHPKMQTPQLKRQPINNIAPPLLRCGLFPTIFRLWCIIFFTVSSQTPIPFSPFPLFF